MNNHPEHLLMKGAIVVLSLTLVMATQKGGKVACQ